MGSSPISLISRRGFEALTNLYIHIKCVAGTEPGSYTFILRFASTAAPAKHTMTPSKAQQSPALPRELIDNIIAELILLHDHDPAYQWTHLRHLARYHKPRIEQHFLNFWVPKLTLTLTEFEPGVRFSAAIENEKSEDNQSGDGHVDVPTVRFTRCTWDGDWGLETARATRPAEDGTRPSISLVAMLGEGVLNKGFTKGGIFSHIRVPGLNNEETTPIELYLEWKPLFTQLFDEEMLMRRFRDALLDDFLPTQKEANPEDVHTAIHKLLDRKSVV